MKNSLIILLFFFSSVIKAQTTYYVAATGGNNSNSGTSVSPWATLAYAVTKAVSGDTVFVMPGRHSVTSQIAVPVGVSIKGAGVTSIISSTYSGTESATILLNSNTQGTKGNQSISYLKLDGNSLTAHVAIEVNARSNVKIHNCEIVNFLRWGVIFNGLSNGWGSSAPNIYATGNEIYNCIITNCAGYADGWGRGCLGVGGQLGFLCHHNTITQPSRGGYNVHGWPWKYYSEGYNKGTKIYNNTFTKAHYLGYDPDWDFAIEICMHEQGGLEIFNNEINGSIDLGARRKGDYEYSAYIHHNILGQVSLGTYREAGIILENVAEDLIIRYNFFRNVTVGIGAHTSGDGGAGDHIQRVYIQYNIFHEIGRTGEAWALYCYQGARDAIWSDIYFENNVVTANPKNQFGYAIQFSPEHKMSNWYIRNNIFTGWYNAYMVGYGDNTSVNNLYTENNIIYKCGNNNDPSWEAPFYPTNWSNKNNLKSDPLFLGGSPYSYELQAGSPAIDAGLNVGLTTDYRNYKVPYNNIPDIGAYEYESSGIPVYVSSAIENNTPNVLEMTYNLSLANIVPVASAFTVMVNSVQRPVNVVTVSGTNVRLTLSTPVVSGNVVTVAYTKPSTNPLQTVSGGEAVSLSAQPVTNKVGAVSPVYVSSVIENSAPSILEMTYNMSLANIVPVSSAFTVMVNSASRSVSSVSISGTKVRLTLSTPVVYGNVVTVAYTKPSTNPLQTASGGEAATLSAQPVTNNVSAVVPVYVRSVIENAAPSVLEMTYNLNLANIVPPASAFSVTVNSSPRSVSSVSVSGTSVRLTLATPVVYGNVVTVAYTKPATNPLQTASGGQAAGITSQSVTNNVGLANTPPTIVLSYQNNFYSGFTGEIDASQSYDDNNDAMEFEWLPPANIEVSSTIGSKIQFLSPMASDTITIEFSLKVTDGKSEKSQTIPVTVLPYKPELSEAAIKEIIHGDLNDDENPYNITDDNLESYWSSYGLDHSLIFVLEQPFKVAYVELAFQEGQRVESYFDVYGSKDNLTWEPLLTGAASCNFAGGYQIFEIPEGKSKTEFSYIKLVSQGNYETSLNNFSEFKVFGKEVIGMTRMTLYPNPAFDFLNIALEYSDADMNGDDDVFNRFIRIFDLSGSLVLEKFLETGSNNNQIHLNLNAGIYIVDLISDGLIISVQKLIILK